MYVGNQPTGSTDPSGLKAQVAPDLVLTPYNGERLQDRRDLGAHAVAFVVVNTFPCVSRVQATGIIGSFFSLDTGGSVGCIPVST